MNEFIQKIRWRPEIGDPSMMGWVTVCAYAIAAIMCWLAARRCGRVSGTERGSKEIWLTIAAVMAVLCVNKQLDLQSLLTDIGRVLSWRQGWYDDRREVQKLFIFGLLGGFALLGGVMLVVCRGFWRRHLLLAVGLVFLCSFIAVRAVSFHHFDVFLKWSPGGVRMNWLLELSGIALIWLAALFDHQAPLGIYRKRKLGESI